MLRSADSHHCERAQAKARAGRVDAFGSSQGLGREHEAVEVGIGGGWPVRVENAHGINYDAQREENIESG